MVSSTLTTSPNLDGILLLEAPFARVPHDELRRQLRLQQRLVERDLTACSNTLATFSTTIKMDSPDAEDNDTSTLTAIADTSFTAETSFLSEGIRPDDSIMTVGDLDDQAEADNDGDRSYMAKTKGSDLEKSLDTMLGRLKGLKRKLTSVHESTHSTLTQLEARTNHLDELHQIASTSSPSFDEWCRTRLDRMLVDWMLRKGFAESARTLAKSRRIENYADVNLFADIERIESSLLGSTLPDGTIINRSCTATLAWCSENKAALRKIRSTLEFDLRLQEFIELTRERIPQSMHEAIIHSRKHLLPLLAIHSMPKSEAGTLTEKEEREEREQQESIRNQIGRAMGLLACGPSGWAYEDLYHLSRWQNLRINFRAAALQIHSLPPQPILHVALSAGLSSLKLPACYAYDTEANQAPAHLGGKAFGDERSNLLHMSGLSTTSVTSPPTFPPAAGMFSQDSTSTSSLIPPIHQYLEGANTSTTQEAKNGTYPHQYKNENCPVCDSQGLGVLAKEVPWSHHANSTLVCHITGKIMDENNPPMALPNGCVYSRAALEELAMTSKDGETVICPRTGEIYPFSLLRKVYIS